jgi:phosphate binding protein
MYRKLPQGLSVLILMTILLTACGGGTLQTEVPSATSAPAESEVMTEAPIMTEAPAGTETPVETQAVEEVPSTGGALPEVDPGSLSGNIVIAGSSTVFPLTEAMADRFKEEGFTEDKGQITIDSIGTGGGFERFCVTGETDISNASRPIEADEVESCRGIGREPIEFRVGTDALAVVVSAENNFMTGVTLEELAMIFSPEATTWADVNPDWPAEEIQRYIPGTDSGTYDYFVEAVMDPVYVLSDADEGKGEEAILGANPNQSEDDNVLVQGIEGSPYAIGFFGFAYYQENLAGLKVLSINDIEPNEQTAESNEYPLSRPLFIYSDATIMAEKPQVAGFINFYLTYVNEEILDVGYFPASDEALNTAKQNWLEAAN